MVETADEIINAFIDEKISILYLQEKYVPLFVNDVPPCSSVKSSNKKTAFATVFANVSPNSCTRLVLG